MLKKMIVLSNLVLTKHQNSIKGINTLTIFPFLVFGDNKVKALKHNMRGAANELPHTLSMVASR
jgi:hypothetical protein